MRQECSCSPLPNTPLPAVPQTVWEAPQPQVQGRQKPPDHFSVHFLPLGSRLEHKKASAYARGPVLPDTSPGKDSFAGPSPPTSLSWPLPCIPLSFCGSPARKSLEVEEMLCFRAEISFGGGMGSCGKLVGRVIKKNITGRHEAGVASPEGLLQGTSPGNDGELASGRPQLALASAQPLAPSDLWGKERRPRNSRSSEKPTDT